MIHKAKDLSPDQKAAVESLLGRQILEGEAVSVRAFEPPALSDQRRQEIVDSLKRYFAQVDANSRSVSAEEAEQAITEAMRSTRPHYAPHP
jgi:L-lactate utilization protein LutC